MQYSASRMPASGRMSPERSHVSFLQLRTSRPMGWGLQCANNRHPRSEKSNLMTARPCVISMQPVPRHCSNV
jgi:hypothetical protein